MEAGKNLLNIFSPDDSLLTSLPFEHYSCKYFSAVYRNTVVKEQGNLREARETGDAGTCHKIPALQPDILLLSRGFPR